MIVRLMVSILFLMLSVPTLVYANAAFPHEPAGFTQINNMPWDCKACNGWSDTEWYGPNSGLITTDATTTGAGTTSPTNVLQLTFPIGLQIGTQPVSMSAFVPANFGRSDIFFGYWSKWVSPWQESVLSKDKEFFLWQNADAQNRSFDFFIYKNFGAMMITLETADNTVCNTVLSDFVGNGGTYVRKCGTVALYPNQGASGLVNVGDWHKIEFLVHPSTTTVSNDGRVRMWLNGTLIQDYQNMNMPVITWSRLQVAYTWGGNATGETKTQVDHVNIDHTYLSAGSSNPPPVDSTPPTTPTSMAATANGVGANLSWTDGTDLNGIANSTIFRCTGAACTPVTLLTTVLGTGTTYTDPGPLTVGTVYGWAVKNADPTGNNSNLSNIAYLTPAAPPATPTFIQDCSGAFHAGSTQVFTSATCNVTAGNLLVGIMTFDNTAGTTILSTVTGGGTWAKATACSHPVAGDSRIEIWYAPNATGGSTTATATLSAADVNGGFMMVEYGGVATSTPLEKVACQKLATPGTTTDAVTSGLQTTTVNGELIVGGALAIDGTATIAGTGFNSRTTYFNDIRLEDKVQPAAGAVAATFTGATGTVDYLAAMATFLAVGTATTPPSITANTPDATGANLSWNATTPPTQIRIAAGSSNFGQYSSTIYPLSAFSPSGTSGRYTNTWVGGLTYECAFAIDANGLENLTGYQCNTLVGIAPPADTVPPVISNGQPSSPVQSGTTQVNFTVTVNEPSTCQWDTVDTTYALMSHSMTVSTLTALGTITGLTDGSITTIYIRCADTVSPLLGGPNVDTSSFLLTISVLSPADVTPPTLSGSSPSGVLPSGTTSVSMQVNTNENATCKYGTIAGTAYASIASTFTTTGATAHAQTITTSDGVTYTYYVRCIDGSTNANTSDFIITWSVSATPPPPDITPPIMSSGAPSGTLALNTTSTDISLTTNEAATCRYGISPNVAYSNLTNTFTTTGGTSHSQHITGLVNGGTYDFFVRCRDVAGNVDTTDLIIEFNVTPNAADTTVPSTVTNLVCTTLGQTQADCSWITATDNIAVAGYQLYTCLISDCSDAVPSGTIVSTLSTTVMNLQASTIYYLAVKAIDTSNNYSASLSNIIPITTGPVIDIQPPSDMTNLRIQLLFSQSAQLTWDLGTDDSGTVTTTIEICTGTIATCADTDFVFRVSKITLNYLVVTLSPNTTYVARGKFSDLSGNPSVNFSNKVQFTTLTGGLPQPRVDVPFTGRTVVTAPIASGTRVPR